MVSFDTNVLVYATASISDVKIMRARDLMARAMRVASSVLLLQTLAEFRVPNRGSGNPTPRMGPRMSSGFLHS
jgi:predicted nucleic acid-binding protein